jgi:hypothetical protein
VDEPDAVNRQLSVFYMPTNSAHAHRTADPGLPPPPIVKANIGDLLPMDEKRDDMWL